MASLADNPFYVPREGQAYNPFAAFWAGFLQTRLPWAQQVFTARLNALDPSEQRAALVELQKQKTELAKAMTENLRAAERNALEAQLSDDRLLQVALQGEYDRQIANARSAADLAVAQIGFAGKQLEAGQLTTKGRDILDRYRTRLRAGQLDLDNAKTPAQRASALTAITEATSEAARESEALGEQELLTFNNQVQREMGRMVVEDPSAQAEVRAIVGPAFQRSAEVPIPQVGGVGAGRPDVNFAAETVARMRGGQAAAPGSGVSSPRDTSSPVQQAPASAASPSRAKSSSGSVAPSSPARDDGAGGGSAPSQPGMMRRASSSSSSMPLGAEEIYRQMRSVDELSGQLQTQDPQQSLGGFTDPLPGGAPRQARPRTPRSPGGGSTEASGILGQLKGSPPKEGQARKEDPGKESRQAMRRNKDRRADSSVLIPAMQRLQAGRPAAPASMTLGGGGTSYGPTREDAPEPKKKPAGKRKAAAPRDPEQTIREALPEQSEPEDEAGAILRRLQPEQSEDEYRLQQSEEEEDRTGESVLEDEQEEELGESEQEEDRLGESSTEEPDTGESEQEDRLGESEQPKKKPKRYIPIAGPIPGRR